LYCFAAFSDAKPAATLAENALGRLTWVTNGRVGAGAVHLDPLISKCPSRLCAAGDREM
jgi:hypothetical protein